MMNGHPSDGLHAFLDQKLDTFEKLEIVLVLRDAGKSLTVSELAVQLQVGREALRRVVAEVEASGVVQLTDGDVVRLTPEKWVAEIAEAANLYKADPTTLFKILTRISMDRIRSRAARTFADAFRIRRKDGG